MAAADAVAESAPPSRRGRRRALGRALGLRAASRATSAADRPAAARGARLEAQGRRLDGFWDAITAPEASSALELTLVVLAHRRAHQRDRGNADRLGARARRASAARASSNALIDLPFALPTIVAGLTLLALYGPAEPGRHQRRLHPGCDRRRAAVRDAAVRRAHGAAGAARARPRDGGGGGLARRDALRDLPAHHPAEPAAGDRSSGVAPRFARAVGEFGSIVLISRQHPVQDARSPRSTSSASSRATTPREQPRSRRCCSSISLVVLLVIGAVRALATRHDAESVPRCASVALGYLALLLADPARVDLLPRVRARLRAGLGRAHVARRGARAPADAARRRSSPSR